MAASRLDYCKSSLKDHSSLEFHFHYCSHSQIVYGFTQTTILFSLMSVWSILHLITWTFNCQAQLQRANGDVVAFQCFQSTGINTGCTNILIPGDLGSMAFEEWKVLSHTVHPPNQLFTPWRSWKISRPYLEIGKDGLHARLKKSFLVVFLIF